MPANLDGSIPDAAIYLGQHVRPRLLERLFDPWRKIFSILPLNEAGFVQWPWRHRRCLANHVSIAFEQ